jgi:hypothetical protein
MSSSTHPGSASSAVPASRRRTLRFLALAIVAAQVPVGIGLFLGSDWARDMWPLPDVRMTYIFLASIVASTATLIAWPVVRDDPGALRAAAFNMSTATPPLGLYLLWLARDGEGRDLVAPGVAFVLFGASWLAIWRWVRRIPVRDTRPLPVAIRVIFVGFCCLLVPVGTALVFQVDGVFPWDLSPENSTVAGIIFLSAAALFAFIIATPYWVYGEAGLASFLAYDVVLAGPYLDFFRNRDDADTVASYYGGGSYAPVAGDNGVGEVSLVVYLSVLAISALVAVAFFAWEAMPRRADGVMPAD